MDRSLKAHIEYLLCIKISNIQSISGGDISEAFLLETDTERFFCKVNHQNDAYTMFVAEKLGLDAISQTKTIAVPKILLCEALEKGGFLVMEYIEPKQTSSIDMERLGHHLAALHRHSKTNMFGWNKANFIGSLPQSNNTDSDWARFYVQERLVPQLKRAKDSKLLSAEEIPIPKTLLQACQGLFPEVVPSLLHGDLWSGNYLISADGTPYLIDPAVYWGHHEVDIAMTRLFGGFGTSFYDAYSESFPKIGGEIARTEIYQLYYLLVHLNLFGSSYQAAVRAILKRYF
ncbi:fructosamine kinase family protein [Aggregatimonas sangjinii]|uniref:Fructosamine kinase family protein n=1 Tax=Aggregatimonas sangjinii TaxID=2583587 RepID=A0A5B7SYN2_9FLAO|nr:fructosamine kinase family protein [Aggregatimonas sangjinii]QCX01904.1 fructosamine kinase family protein [Aggregatimonas sangjinii]